MGLCPIDPPHTSPTPPSRPIDSPSPSPRWAVGRWAAVGCCAAPVGQNVWGGDVGGGAVEHYGAATGCYGALWGAMGCYEALWDAMGHLWGSYGALWGSYRVLLGAARHLRGSMGRCGSLWGAVGQLWGAMGWGVGWERVGWDSPTLPCPTSAPRTPPCPIDSPHPTGALSSPIDSSPHPIDAPPPHRSPSQPYICPHPAPQIPPHPIDAPRPLPAPQMPSPLPHKCPPRPIDAPRPTASLKPDCWLACSSCFCRGRLLLGGRNPAAPQVWGREGRQWAGAMP